MKTINKLLITQLMVTGVLALLSHTISAAELTVPHKFMAGETAVADDVNDNFSTLRDAIVDNTNQLATKQNMLSGECAQGSSIRVINADGSVVCELDDVGTSNGISAVNTGYGLTGGGTTGTIFLRLADGAVSVGPEALDVVDSIVTGCIYERGLGSGRWKKVGYAGVCSATASVYLPDHAKITGLTCYVEKDTPSDDGGASFIGRLSYAGSTLEAIVGTSNPAANSGTTVQKVQGVPSAKSTINIVDNTNYYYLLEWKGNLASADATTNGAHFRFKGCSISYTFNYTVPIIVKP